MCLKLQIPYYQALILWLLGATNDNNGEAVMHIKISENINHLNGNKTSKCTSNFNFPIIAHWFYVC